MSDVIREAKVLLIKITPKLQIGEFGVKVCVDTESRLREIDGHGIVLSYCRSPISMNSVL